MANIVHGGDMKSVQLRFPTVQKPWIDLSTGLNPNPYPWLDKVPVKHLEIASHKLPQQNSEECCKLAWTRYLAVENPDEWLLVSGSQAFINLLPRLFPNHHALILMPNYGEHERVWAKSKNGVQKILRKELDTYNFKPQTLVVLTNPNNPDGHAWSKEYLIKLADKLKQNGGMLIIDEAFADVMSENSLASSILAENIIILRSFGKFFGLGGLRLGLVRVPTEIFKTTIFELGPWSVNSLALAIAESAFNDKQWITDTLEQLNVKMERLKQTLLHAGFKTVGKTDLFCLIEHDDAKSINKKLNENGIFVRVFKEYPTLLRFGLFKNNDQLLRLQEALK